MQGRGRASRRFTRIKTLRIPFPLSSEARAPQVVRQPCCDRSVPHGYEPQRKESVGSTDDGAEGVLGKCTERNARDVGTVASAWAGWPQERIIVRSILKRDTALSACG